MPYKIPSKAILGAGTPQTRKKARAGAPKMCPRLIKSAKNQANNERLQTKRPCTKLGAAVLPPGGLSIKPDLAGERKAHVYVRLFATFA